jgi:hypothetical protein
VIRARESLVPTATVVGGGRRDGVVSIIPGGGRFFSRLATAWVEQPLSGRHAEVGSNREQLTAPGLRMEREAERFLIGAIGAWPTGWGSPIGEGTNGSDLRAATDGLGMWDPDVQCLEFLAGNPHSAALGAVLPATGTITTGPSLGNLWTLSIYHLDLGGEKIQFRLQRTSDSKYWPGAAPWAVGETWNDIPISATEIQGSHFLIDQAGGANSDSYTVAIRQPSGGTPSRLNRVYHVQAALCAYPPSARRLSQEGKDLLVLPNYSGQRILHQDRGTFLAKVLTQWDEDHFSVQTTTPDRALFQSFHDASNYIRFFVGVGPQLRYVSVAGGNTVANLSPDVSVPAGGGPHVWGCRWIGSAGELGLASRTVHLFADGANLGGGVASALPSETAFGRFLLGCQQSEGSELDGTIAAWLLTDDVLTDEEIRAWGQ